MADKILKRLGQAAVAGLVLVLATSASAQPPPDSAVPSDRKVGQASSSPTATELPDRLGEARRPSDPRSLAETAQRPGSLLGDVVGDFGAFFGSRETYAILGLGLGTSLSVRPLDGPITTSRFNAERFEGGGLDRLFEPGELLGGTLMQVGGAFTTYGVGKLAGRPEVAALGRDLVRAQLLTQGVTQLVKRTVRRTRPDGSSRSSYPSGHTSGAFATATVLQRRYGWKAAAPAFGVACYISASRLSENKHFLSDLAFGAAIGLAAGRTVTLDRGSTRLELAPTALPGGVGVRISLYKRPSER